MKYQCESLEGPAVFRARGHLTAARSNSAVFCSDHPYTYWLLLIIPTPEGLNPELRLSAQGLNLGLLHTCVNMSRSG